MVGRSTNGTSESTYGRGVGELVFRDKRASLRELESSSENEDRLGFLDGVGKRDPNANLTLMGVFEGDDCAGVG